MAYRAMPHTVTGRGPAELLFNRSIQTKLPKVLREDRSREDRELHEKHNREKESAPHYSMVPWYLRYQAKFR